MNRFSEPIRYRFGSSALVTGYIFLLLAVILIGYIFAYPRQMGVKQPIPFSHRFHNTRKQISCVMCHENVFTGDNAGIPPLETCLLCHTTIITDYPDIIDLRTHYLNREPIRWVRVSFLPDFVYFTHQMHTRRGFDCGKCHGDVAQMDRIDVAHEFTMGFCIQCHRDENATHDCFTCHR